MPRYEVVRKMNNHCPRNQMRDVFFEEVETDQPEEYVRTFLKGKAQEIRTETLPDGDVEVYAVCDGISQRFLFTLD